MNRKSTLTLAAVLMLLGALPAVAQTSSIIDHYTLTLGTYLSSQDATIRYDASGGTPGTPIDFEDEFGLDKNASLFRYNFDWRVGQKHLVSFGGYRTSREATKQIDRDIEFGGVTYPVNTEVTGKLTINFYDAAYTYYPYLRADKAFGITGSLVTMGLNTRLTSEPTSGSGTTELNRRASANLPAPGFGISYRQQFGDHWRFDTRASFLPKITIDKWDAKTANVNAGIEYRFLDHYSVGAAYDYFAFQVGVNSDKGNFTGNFKYSISGPQAYARFYW